jgi:hypothetical protein
MPSRAGGASGRSDADVSSTGRGTCVRSCVQFSDVYATMDAFGLESGVNVHFCVQFTEVYAEMDTYDHETAPNRPQSRTVSRSVRNCGRIRRCTGSRCYVLLSSKRLQPLYPKVAFIHKSSRDSCKIKQHRVQINSKQTNEERNDYGSLRSRCSQARRNRGASV